MVFSSSLPPSLPLLSLCVFVLWCFDGLVSSLCLPLSLHSAFQRGHGPEAGNTQRNTGAQGGVRAEGEKRVKETQAGVT